jgi:tRNA-specific adenosine deaminase 1
MSSPDSDSFAPADAIVSASFRTYSNFSIAPQPGKFTILASIALCAPIPGAPPKLLSLATGSKCLPAARLPSLGAALHDSHAEVLARRGAVYWLFEEIQRVARVPGPDASPWLHCDASGMYALRPGVRLYLYVSTVPCKTLRPAGHILPPLPELTALPRRW